MGVRGLLLRHIFSIQVVLISLSLPQPVDTMFILLHNYILLSYIFVQYWTTTGTGSIKKKTTASDVDSV